MVNKDNKGIEHKIISIEGTDRSGKSTLLNQLLKNTQITFKKFPDKESKYGELIYNYLKNDLDKLKENYSRLHSQDKNKGIEEVIKYLEKEGKGGNNLLLVDRFDVSQYVYGKSLGIAEPLENLKYKSDYVIYLDITPEESMRRGNILGDSDLLEEDTEILFRVNGYYNKYLKELESKGSKVFYIDGTLSQEKVYNKVKTILDSLE